MALLEQYKDKPFFFFVHFAEVDHSGHKHAENSKEYNDALIPNDTWTGKIVDQLKALGLYDKTLVYVTADHGFNEGASNPNPATPDAMPSSTLSGCTARPSSDGLPW